MNLTLYQYCALDGHRNWVVSTGAGAGKTTVLTQRFISLLEQFPDLKIQEILALTFTQKAAEEMKQRIYNMVNDRVYDKNQDPDRKQRFWIMKEEFEENKISTFHAFCMQLIKSYPIESKVDPEFRLVSEYEQKEIFQDIYAEVFQEYVRKEKNGSFNTKNKIFLDLLQCWEEYQLRGIVFQLLKTPREYYLFNKFFSEICGKKEEFLEKVTSQFLSDAFEKLFAKDFYGELVEATKIIKDIDVDKDKAEYVDLIGKILSTLDKIRKPHDLLSIRDDVASWLEHEAIVKKTRVSKVSLTAVKIREHLLKTHIHEIDPEFEWYSLKYLGMLIHFVNHVFQKYQSYCKKNHLLDFDGLQENTLNLLVKNPSVLEKIREKFQYVLIDEFQDTDPLQWEILKLIIGFSDNDQSKKTFIVGDEKQAIYGFRGGDVRVFRKAKEDLIKLNQVDLPLFFEEEKDSKEKSKYYQEVLGLKNNSPDQYKKIIHGDLIFCENFRSHKTPIEFFNEFFNRLFSAENEFDPKSQELTCTKKSDDPLGSVSVFVVSSEGDESNDNDQDLSHHMKEAKMMAEHLKKTFQESSLLRKAIAAKKTAVGVLFRRFTQIKAYEEVFRQYGIDFFVHKGKGFFRRQEILDLYNALEFLNDSRKDIHLVGLLRSAAFGLKDEEIYSLREKTNEKTLFRSLKKSKEPKNQEIYERLQSWLQLKDRLRISEILRRIISDSVWTFVFGIGSRGQQTLYNIEKFIEMARKYEKRGLRGLAGFCQYIRGQIDHDEREGEASLDFGVSSPVVFMTIHQSKGLQFPMVMLPDLNGRFRFPKGDILEELDGPQRYFFGIKCPNPNNGFKKDPTLIRQILHKKAKQKMLAEEKRLLYVGCTRAEEHLILLGRNLKKNNNKQDLSFEECSSMWDWVEKIFQIQEGCDNTQISENGPNYPVSWYQPKGNLQNDIKNVGIPSFSLSDLEKVNGFYQIDTKPISVDLPIMISPSYLGTFLNCHRKYYYQKGLGVPEFFSFRGWNQKTDEEDLDFEISKNERFKIEADLKGLIVHQILEKPHEIDAKNIAKNVDKLLKYHIREMNPSTRCLVHVDSLKGDIFDHIRKFYEKSEYFSKFVSLSQSTPPRIFHELAFDLEYEKIHLTGSIDVFYQSEKNGKWSILDYKTNHISPPLKKDPKKLMQWVQKNHYDLQLNCYALAAEQIMGKGSVEKIELYFTEDGLGSLQIPLQIDQIKMHLKKLDNVFGQQRIPLLDEMKPKDNSICDQCGYQLSKICAYPSSV